MSVSVNKTYSAADLKFLNLLSEKFPTIADATTEIINLEAILNLPKGTEHFLTDLHGEYEAFRHVLKNASGVIRQKVHEVFNNTLRESEMTELCTLIYYPAEKLQLIKQKESNLDDWYKVTLNQLTEVWGRFGQIHPLEGAQDAASGFFLCHSGASPQIRFAGIAQTELFQRDS